MKSLSQLPNIGKELENRLNFVGINSFEKLKSMGSCKAFQLLHAVDTSVCINTLMALEGAVQEIRWHHLDPDKKLELKEFWNMLNNF